MFLICIKIYFARIIDVSIGSIRTITIVRGKSIVSAILAFIETIIWFLVAKEALLNGINSIIIPIVYSLGYATGTLIGTYISNNFLDSLIGVQVITKKNNTKLIKQIRSNGFGLSIMNLKKDIENKGKDLLLIQLNKKSLKKLINIIKNNDKFAFIIINETKYVQNGLIK